MNVRSFLMVTKTETTLTKGERTRMAIEDAAYALFLEQGFHATSMRQIAEKTGLALGGIYNYFESKDDIFRAIILDKHPYKQVIPVLSATGGDTAEEFFHNVARALLQELGKRPDLLKLMFIEIVEFDARHVPSLFREIIPKALPLFQRLAEKRRELRTIHPAVLMRSFLGLFFSYYVTEKILGETIIKLMPKNSFEMFVDIYLHGILREPA